MYPFTYLRAESLAAASEALRKDPDAKLLAGGQTLLPSLKLRLARPTALIDLAAITELRGITAVDDAIVVGAMTRHAEVAADATVRAGIPALAALAGHIGDRMVRNMGTLGGSIANNDPAADYPAALVALNATITTTVRTIPAEHFFRGLFETALAPDEIVTAVSFTKPRRSAYLKFRNAASRFALVGVFVADTHAGPRVAITGAGARVFRVSSMEDALRERFTPAALDGASVSSAELNSDLHASAEYRAHLIPVLARRAVEMALSA